MTALVRSTAALARALRRSRHASRVATFTHNASTPVAASYATRTLSTLRHNVADARLGIGYLQLAPEEIEAERELVGLLPDFQQAMEMLHGESDAYKQLPNAKKATLAIPNLERTVEICRSAMGFQSVYLLATLRHLCLAYFAAGQYASANKMMQERGDAMDWPMAEQERVLRLFLRQSQPALGLSWCQKDVFTALFPKDDTVPIKWTMYELMAKTLQHGPSELHVRDPMFARAVDVLRMKEDVIAQTPGNAADGSLLSHEIPHLMSQYAALSLAASGALDKNASELSELQHASQKQAEVLWRESLAWVEKITHAATTDELATGIDASFEASIQTNLGELLLRMDRTDEAMALLGKALQTQQSEKGGNALALSRVLSKIAQGCHRNGQAVSSEGLFTSVLDAFEKETHLSLTDQVEYALALRAYGALLKDWDKREKDSQLKIAKAGEIERAIAAQCATHACAAPLHPVFYLPL